MLPNDDVQISALTAQDVPQLEELETLTRLCFWGSENYIRFLTQTEYFGSKAVATVKSQTSRMIGFYLARSVVENLELLKIGVYPQFQNKGIGARLLDNALSEGIRRGCQRCYLEVRMSNESAIRFYLNHRFRVAGERANYYSDPVEDALVMERRL